MTVRNRTCFLILLINVSFVAWTGWGMELKLHPIFHAIDVGDKKELKRLCASQVSPWQQEFNALGQSALYYAVLKGDPEIVLMLLKHEANPNIKNFSSPRADSSKTLSRKNQTPLRYLVEKTNVRQADREIFDLLLQYGAPNTEAERKALVRTIKKNLSLKKVAAAPSEDIEDFSRLLFRFLRTHINSPDFEKSKIVWHIFGRGTTFAFLMRETLEQDFSAATYSDMIEILDKPEAWIFSHSFPSAPEMNSIFANLEAVLQPLHFLRFAFVMQQSFYQWLEEEKEYPHHGSKAKESASADAISRPDQVCKVLKQYHRKGALLADDIFSLDRGNFLAISPQEFVQHVLRIRSIEGFHHQVKFAAGLKNLVLFSILYDLKTQSSSAKSRDREKAVKAYETWLTIGEKLFHLGDLFGAQTIFAALEGSCFQRLKIGLGKREKHKSTIQYLENSERFAKYRKFKETCLAKPAPLIPLCSCEASDIAINSEIPAQVLRHGVKMFNTEKVSVLSQFINEWALIQQTIRETSVKGEGDPDRLRKAIMAIPDEYPNFLSYCITPKPTFTRAQDRKILPLWEGDDFEDFYCHVMSNLSESIESHENFCAIIEHATLQGLCNGLALFYEYLSLAEKRKLDNWATSGLWREELFKAIEDYLTAGVIEGINAFDKVEEKDLYNIRFAARYTRHMAKEDWQSEKDAAQRRWVIHLVKKHLADYILPLKEQGIVDCESFLEVFGQFADLPGQEEDNKVLHLELRKRLEHYGVDKLGKRLKFRNLLLELSGKL